MMQPMLPPRPARRLAALDVLAGQPPARNFVRLARIAKIVDDEDVSNIARHLGRDVGVSLVNIEAMDADATRLLVTDEPRPIGRGNIVDLEATVVIAALLELLERAQIILGHAHPLGDLFPRRLTMELLPERAPDRRQLIRAP